MSKKMKMVCTKCGKVQQPISKTGSKGSQFDMYRPQCTDCGGQIIPEKQKA